MSSRKFGDLTIKYTPMIVRIAQKLHHAFGKKHDIRDLIAEGELAALQAEKTYDPERGEFSTYIRLRVRGAILTSITNTSSKHQRTLDRIYRYIDNFVLENGEIPSVQMVLKALNIKETAYRAALSASADTDKLSLAAIGEEGITMDEREDLEDAISKLPDVERDAVNAMLQDKRYDKRAFDRGVLKLRKIMEIEK